MTKGTKAVQIKREKNFFQGGWFMGKVACDIWLAVDYVASNASVLNLLIICIDRYDCLKKKMIKKGHFHKILS